MKGGADGTETISSGLRETAGGTATLELPDPAKLGSTEPASCPGAPAAATSLEAIEATISKSTAEARTGSMQAITPPSAAGCLHDHFEAQVDTNGSAPALACGDLVLSYAELEAQANRLARHMRSAGAGHGSLIGLCLSRSEKPIVAILACLKAGAAYVPIDPTHPEERIRHIIEEAELSLIVCDQAAIDRVGTVFNGTLVSVDGSAAEIAAHSAARLTRAETGITPEDLCYVIYTSGTTGRPKGVMTEHRSAYHFVSAFNAVCTTRPSDRIYQGFSPASTVRSRKSGWLFRTALLSSSAPKTRLVSATISRIIFRRRELLIFPPCLRCCRR